MDRFDGMAPPDDEGWWDDRGVPEGLHAALAEYVLHCLIVHVCRAEEAAGVRYPGQSCPGLDRVAGEAFERGVEAIKAEGGAGIARLAAEFWASVRADWPARLPHPPPDDDDDRAS
jgi:hypothetical protein